VTDEATRRLEQALHETLSLPVGARREHLERLAAQDETLALSLRKRLDEAETSSGASPAAEAALPESLGGCRILGVLGRGGMGTVYRAEQLNPRREVAIKVLRAAPDDTDALRRFRQEAEALALLNHPNIARVYAAGVEALPHGPVPYLILELVRGRTLLDWCNGAGLDTRRRVALIAAICKGVQHAHVRGVIHRDLKPANILVDEEGQPRIMDFGIARIVDEPGEATTRMTEAGQLVGTLPYMSPEQLSGDPSRIDLRTDVYALGVILYELLCGRRPRELDETTLMAALRSAETRPLVPLAKAMPAARGDLDTLVMKALSEDPERRYASAGEFAADLERFLDDRPIEARPPSSWYVFSRFTRRNRALVAASAIAVLALIASTIFSGWSALRERDARREAEARATETRAVNGFLNEMFASADPELAQGREVTVKEVLDAASAGLKTELAGQPQVAADVGLTLSGIYQSLGHYDRSEALLDGATAALQTLPDQAPDQLADLDRRRAKLRIDQGKYEEAERLARAAAERASAALGANDGQTLLARWTLAQAIDQQGRYDEAIALLRELIPLAGNLEQPLRVIAIDMRADLASALRDKGDYVEAERETLVLREEMTRARGELHPDVLTLLNNLGTIQQRLGKPVDAEATFKLAFERRKQVLGPDHPSTLLAQQNHTNALIEQKRGDEAEASARYLAEVVPRVRGRESQPAQVAMNSLAFLLEDKGDLVGAEKLYREILQIQSEQADPMRPETFATRNNLAMLLMREGKLAEAAKEFGVLLVATERALGKGHVYYALFANNTGECLTRLGRYAEAEPLLVESHAVLEKSFGATHARVRTSLERRAALYRATGRAKDAEALLESS